MNVKFKRLFSLRKKTDKQELIQSAPLIGGLVVLGALLYIPKLTSLVPFSVREAPELLGSANVDQIINSMLFAPSKIMQFLILKIGDNDSYIRIASVISLAVAAVLLFILLRKWHTKRITALTMVLFLCSSWVLHNGRFAAHEIMYMWVVPALILSCLWLLSKDDSKKLFVAAALVAVVLYIPGTWLLLLAGLLGFRKYILRTAQKCNRKILLACGALFTVGVLPLFYSFAVNKSQVASWLGYNTNQSFMPQDIAQNFITIADQLLWRGISDPAQWVTGTPILDIFTVVMVVLGIYAYRVGYYPAREKLVFGLFIVGVLLIGFGNIVTVGLLIPLVYLLAANGMAYMLQSWFTVFPKNPAARPVGVVLLTLVVVLSCSFNLQRYFIVWPNVPATKQALNRV